MYPVKKMMALSNYHLEAIRVSDYITHWDWQILTFIQWNSYVIGSKNQIFFFPVCVFWTLGNLIRLFLCKRPPASIVAFYCK